MRDSINTNANTNTVAGGHRGGGHRDGGVHVRTRGLQGGSWLFVEAEKRQLRKRTAGVSDPRGHMSSSPWEEGNKALSSIL